MSNSSIDVIASRILVIRSRRVMLDSDLAALYGVETKRLNEQVRRNASRFPAAYMFQPSNDEAVAPRSQLATLNAGRGQHRKFSPLAFTEHGALMLSSVLNSPQAVQVSIMIMDAFVQLREFAATHRELAGRVDVLERKTATYDQAIVDLCQAIRRLSDTPAPRSKPIGFTARIG